MTAHEPHCASCPFAGCDCAHQCRCDAEALASLFDRTLTAAMQRPLDPTIFEGNR